LLTPFQFGMADEVINEEEAEAAVTIDNHKDNTNTNVNTHPNAGVNTVSKSNTISGEAGTLFQILDHNHDHKLTLSDFNYMDTDKNEQITLDEFKTVISNGSGVSGGISGVSGVNGGAALIANTKKKFFTNTNGNGNGNDDDTGGFTKGFTSSTAMIIATEIGDKTFFIAAVLSMRHARLTVFAGAILALICMTILR
jgi:hypothetical protein